MANFPDAHAVRIEILHVLEGTVAQLTGILRRADEQGVKGRPQSTAATVAAMLQGLVDALKSRVEHDAGHAGNAFDVWRAWFRNEQAKGNVVCLSEISRARHGDECSCDECTDCPMCSGEACNKCGAGCWNTSVTDCEHDVLDRHEHPDA